MDYAYKLIDSPVGQLTLVARGDRLAAILWENDRAGRVRLGEMVQDDERAVLVKAAAQLVEYFAGNRNEFDVPLDFDGTDFQKQVWAALLTIPYGQTRTYLQIARQLGNEKAVRAVGAANGRNPISIIAPCHRVIGAGGELTGFAGGLHAKKLLLAIEGISTEGRDAGQSIDPRRKAQHRRIEDPNQLPLL
ncbi:methylated-DNA--[protein]-cysteine S-methyltransferase [Herbaspirillum sp. LeCh32-8]|uniref:methylated-DNA--[protein]-cysteine S-methyltransferase n=1 Tax=Herbaspirillum sp. LeCh32-8 TaxID=2821356 RepID=UPI001AE8ECB1|nr:methylated-DNA--[protein]-cysteine S-methyltransferase [Herbaspirillum sp. LeCh32-8]MBP0599045.1 methylated-DNA--[protein]-cysteine S-methyltransferase [Herbaspirillum sp. LeCh32-8]